jgi:hypothetical protein
VKVVRTVLRGEGRSDTPFLPDKPTLTKLYNQRPTWLDLAHKQLDRAVFDACGWPPAIADEEILSRLLALNLERAAQGGMVVPVEERDQDRDD